MNLEVVHRRLYKTVRILLALVIAQSITLFVSHDEQSSATPKDVTVYVSEISE